MDCDACRQPLIASGLDTYHPCANPECVKCPKCAKHDLPIKSGAKCATCLEEVRAAAAEELRQKAGTALGMLKLAPIDYLNGKPLKLDCPGFGPAAGDYPSITVAGKSYSLIHLTGDTRKKRLSVAVGDESRSVTFGLGGDGPPCFYLPWQTDSICYMKLDASVEWFITARMNGCCTMIGGPADAPTVVHANLNSALPDVALTDTFEQTRIKQLRAYTDAYNAAKDVLVQRGILSDTIQMFDPGFYMGQQRGGRGVVFGQKKGDNKWTFYYQLDLSLRVPWRWFGKKGWEWGFHGDWIKKWDTKEIVAQANKLWPDRADP